jgi:hypothetical protein
LSLKTGGVPMGPGGYKDGGKVTKSGIIKTYQGVGPYNTTEMHEAKPNNDSSPTGEVKLGNGGGYKRGGKVMKKATGGVMKSTKPGEYKKGGMMGGGMAMVEKDGKMVPSFAADGKGKMKKGGMMHGGMHGNMMGGYKKGGAAKKADGGVSFSSVAKEAGDMVSPRRLKQIIGMEPEDIEVAHTFAGTKPPRVPFYQGGDRDRQGYKDLKKLKALGFDTRTGETGFKKGGAAKKFADGGRVQDDGRPVKMPNKAPSDPVAISRLSGTFKKGGSVKRKNQGGAMGTQPNKEEKGEAAWRAGEKSENEAMRNAMNPANWFKPLIEKFKGAPGAVTETTKSKTVVPAKKYGGKAC